MTAPRTNVLVTACSGTNTGTQVMTALLRLPEKYRVVTADMDHFFYGRYVSDAAHTLPPANHPEYLGKLSEVCRKQEIQYLVPGSEPELGVLSENLGHFAQMGIEVLINDPGVIALCMDKLQTIQFLQEKGFPAPRSMAISRGRQKTVTAEAILDNLLLPLVIKPYRNSGGSKGLSLVQSREDLELLLGRLAGRTGLYMMAQEYEGSADNEYTVGVMSSPSGEAFSSFALKRLINSTLTRLTHEPNLDHSRVNSEHLTISTGISQGWVGDFPEIRSFCQQVAAALGSTGPMNLQCRATAQGVMVFEINPRFSGTTSIRALCGHNDPDMIIESRTGRETPAQAEYKHGLVLRTLDNLLVEGLTPLDEEVK